MKQSQRLTHLVVSIGGFHQGFLELTVDMDTHVLSYYQQRKMVAPCVRTLDEQEMAQLREGLDKVRIKRWDSKYIEPNILDGTIWKVELTFETYKQKKSGHQKFPEAWDAFTALLDELINDDSITV
ncbi:hypothetical protein SAMN05421839_12723 [Halolactibacillus halophilus]|uniref:Uncharacterized protein n=1 Tax=Halolactibacillus halophilus TaxID=306540 RepID=A0A1I5R7G5_9BACI|nr:hypothetical protein [Halolactibacillus halophilus]GEM02142.1 hypothetical protein HHA03_16740 [Halolactibacillus halophilus]SFP54241.1 hypothetical protein SAMN05421839_12723 [Halolactibacillus halophilus]